MKIIKSKYASLIFLLLFVGTIFYYFRLAITPFAISMVFAYLTMPIVNFFEKHKIRRGIASFLIIILLIICAFYTIVALIPFLISKITGFIALLKTSSISIKQSIHLFLKENMQLIGPENTKKTEEYLFQFMEETFDRFDLLNALETIEGSGSNAFNALTILIPCPVIMFYMLRDWKKMISKIQDTIPRRYVDDFIQITNNIDSNLSKYLRGQVLVCFVLAILYSIPYFLIGLNFGIPIGIMTGCLAFIPYVGAIISAIITIAATVMQFGDTYHIFLVLSIIIIGQGIDGSLITPSIIGDQINIHPTWVILGLFSSMVLFGTFGTIFALPITACGSVIAKFIIEKYKESDFYHKP